jgi:hypothetical protein
MSERASNNQHKELDYFRHRPLSLTRDQFRLIKITLDGPNGSVLCNVRHFDRADKDAYRFYTALSYTWGDLEAANPVYMQHTNLDEEAIPAPFTVTRNLANVLRHIIDAGRSEPERKRWKGWWWIDALCIIQTQYDPEKDRQIKRMPATYSDAAEVYAWIGPSTAGTDMTMCHIDERFHAPSSTRTERKLRRKESWRKFPEFGYFVGLVFNRPYWRRLWIIQELCMCSKTTVACGLGEVSLQALYDYANGVVTMEPEKLASISLEGAYDHVMKTGAVIKLAMTYRRQNSSMSLANLIDRSRHSVCGMDKKDYIRALLGLVGRGQGLHIDASQHQCPCSIITAAMQAMTQDIDPQCTHDTDLKSWCEENIRKVDLITATTSNHTGTYCDSYEEILSMCRGIALLICTNSYCECI